MKIYVYLVLLKWDIMFDDADEGECYAGDGLSVLRVFTSESAAESFIEPIRKVLPNAEKESIVWPTQPNNKVLKEILGFTLHDVDQSGKNFTITIKEIEAQ